MTPLCIFIPYLGLVFTILSDRHERLRKLCDGIVRLNQSRHSVDLTI